MALAIRSETTGAGTAGFDGTFSVTKPSDVQNNDYLVVIIGMAGSLTSALTITPPGDWTTAEQGGGTAGTDSMGGVYYKLITNAAGEPASYTFDATNVSDSYGYWIGSLSGGNLTTLEDVDFDTGAGAFAYLQDDVSPAAPAVTTVTAGAMAFAVWIVGGDTATTQPGGSWSARADSLNINIAGDLQVASQTFPTAGTSTGTPEITDVSAIVETTVGMFVFRPVAGGGPANLKTINGLTKASVKTINGLAIASVKTWNGLA